MIPSIPSAPSRSAPAAGCRKAALTAAGVGALFLLLMWKGLGLGPVDDTYIMLRYGRNWADGHGLVFNPGGERVEGFTSTLWTFLAAAACRMRDDPIGWMVGGSFLASLGLLAGVARWGCRRTPACGWMAAVLLAANVPFACWAFSGMDASLHALMSFSALALVLGDAERNRRPWRSGGMMGLLIWTRLEGMTVFAAGVLWRLWRCARTSGDWKSEAKALAVHSAAFLPFAAALAAWRWSYYRDLTPNTFHAKVGRLSLPLLRTGLEYAATYWAVHAVWWVPLLAAWLRKQCPDPAQQLLLIAASASSVGVAVVGGDHFAQYRFLLPVSPLLACAAAPALAEGWARLKHRAGRAAAMGAVALTVAIGFALPARFHAYLRAAVFLDDVRTTADLAIIGRFLKTHAAPGSSIAVITAGALPYYSGLPTLDMLGWNDRTIAARDLPTGVHGIGMIGHEKHDADYVLSRRPTYLFSLQAPYPAAQAIVRDPRFLRDYEAAPVEIPGVGMLVLVRRKES